MEKKIQYNGGIPIVMVCEVLCMIKKLLKWVLCLLIVGSCLLSQAAASPVLAQAPLYAADARSNSTAYTTLENAAVTLRQKMVERQNTVTLYVQTNQENLATLCEDIFFMALEHTGNPKEGDYLRWHFTDYSVSCRVEQTDHVRCNVTLDFTLHYYTDAQQEAAVDRKVAEVLQELDFSDGTDYEKICKIYDYLCTHVTYDHTNKNNAAYTLKYTAYAAAVNGTSVCQGYATLLYRMALELGIDARVISGIGQSQAHGWNIVKLGSRYYNVDATWDSERASTGAYAYFLRCNDNFADHTRDAQYDTAAFHGAYPMGTEDCTEEPPPSEDSGNSGTQPPGGTDTPTEPEPPQQTQPTPTIPIGDIIQQLQNISLPISKEKALVIAGCLLLLIIVIGLVGRRKKRRRKKRRRK